MLTRPLGKIKQFAICHIGTTNLFLIFFYFIIGIFSFQKIPKILCVVFKYPGKLPFNLLLQWLTPMSLWKSLVAMTLRCCNFEPNMQSKIILDFGVLKKFLNNFFFYYYSLIFTFVFVKQPLAMPCLLNIIQICQIWMWNFGWDYQLEFQLQNRRINTSCKMFNETSYF